MDIMRVCLVCRFPSAGVPAKSPRTVTTLTVAAAEAPAVCGAVCCAPRQRRRPRRCALPIPLPATPRARRPARRGGGRTGARSRWSGSRRGTTRACARSSTRCASRAADPADGRRQPAQERRNPVQEPRRQAREVRKAAPRPGAPPRRKRRGPAGRRRDRHPGARRAPVCRRDRDCAAVTVTVTGPEARSPAALWTPVGSAGRGAPSERRAPSAPTRREDRAMSGLGKLNKPRPWSSRQTVFHKTTLFSRAPASTRREDRAMSRGRGSVAALLVAF